MRKTRIFALLATVLVVAMLLTACAVSSAKSFDKVLNPDYDASEKLWASAAAVSELADYSLDESNGTFAVFTKANEETGALTTKVYSLLAAKVIVTVTDTETTSNSVSISWEMPIVTVNAVTTTEATEETEAKTTTTTTLYDAQGTQLATASFDEDTAQSQYAKVTPIAMADLVVINYVAYEVDEETGAFTKKMDIPEYVMLDGDVDDIEVNDDYYYVYAYDTVSVYDKEFNLVSVYTTPSYAVNEGMFVLNNGDILVQYSVELDEDAKEFDYYKAAEGFSMKMDLVTLVVDAEKGTAKEVDLDYEIYYVMPNYDLYDEEDDNNYYNDKFDNIAYVYPIVDQKIDYSDAAEDIVLMNNKGKVKKSLKIVDGQTASLPVKIADDLYRVQLLSGGYALTDIDGDVKKVINSYMTQIGSYFVGDRGIYDLELNLVYSFVDNNIIPMYDDASYDYVGDTIFVMVGTEDKYTVEAFCNGEQKTVFSYDAENETNGAFEMMEFGYEILTTDGDYKYYNAAGTELLTTTTAITYVAMAEDTAIYMEMATVEDVQKPTYYVFSK